jgi:hypothetical protein
LHHEYPHANLHGPALRRRARAKAAALGISLSEYVGRLVAQDLGESETRGFAEAGAEPEFDIEAPAKPAEVAQGKRKPDISIFFNLIDEGPPTDIARDKDKMVGEAVWQEYLHETGRKARRRRR